MAQQPTFFATEADFRRWLEANHETAPELLVGFWKKGSGKPSIDWPQARDQALCFGWIDGVRKSLGEEAYTIRFTPRRKGSIWSKVNVERFAALKAEGLMTPAGERAYEENKQKSGLYAYETAAGRADRRGESAVPQEQGRLGRLGEAPARLPQGRAPLGDQRQEAGNPREALATLIESSAAGRENSRLRHRPEEGGSTIHRW